MADEVTRSRVTLYLPGGLSRSWDLDDVEVDEENVVWGQQQGRGVTIVPGGATVVIEEQP